MASDPESSSEFAWMDQLMKEISDKYSPQAHTTLAGSSVPKENEPDHLTKKFKTSSDQLQIPCSDALKSLPKEMTAAFGDDESDSGTSTKSNKVSNTNQAYYRDLSTGRLCCTICDKSFLFPAGVYAHHRNVHKTFQKPLEKPENIYKLHCLTCDKRFPAMLNLYRHQKLVHPDSRIFNCDICNKTFNTVGKVKMHKHARNKSKVEASDPSLFASKAEKIASLRNKISSRNQNKQYYRDLSTGLLCCTICDKSFISSSCVFDHYKRCHQSLQKVKEKPEIAYKLHCLNCDKRFPAMYDIFRHQQVFHPDSRSFKCEICNKTFNTVGKVKVHNHGIHRNKRKGEPIPKFGETSAQEKSTPTEPCNISMDEPAPAPMPTVPQSQKVECADNWIVNPVTQELTPIKIYPKVLLLNSSNISQNTCPIQAFPVQLDSSTTSSNH